MVGKKGRSGRKIKWKNNLLAERNRKVALEYYYKHHEQKLAYARQYHKRIRDYADEHNISFEEARRRLAEQKQEETKK